MGRTDSYRTLLNKEDADKELKDLQRRCAQLNSEAYFDLIEVELNEA